MRWTADLRQLVLKNARTAGFQLAGVAAAPAATDADGVLTAERFSQWVADGRAGEMEYLKRSNMHGELLRRSAREAMPWARSVVVCAWNYNLEGTNGPAPSSLDEAGPDKGWIARYAWSGGPGGEPLDYHDDLLRRLRAVEHVLVGASGCQAQSYVDTGPVLERDFAARAGIGWIGKNTCVLNQQLGSWLLLGVIVTSLEGSPELLDLPTADRCGSCTRCIDACPTDALVAPHEMDASRCIAYLTIEKKGNIAEELRPGMGRQVFGCDICQEVCPWNRRVPVSDGWIRRDELINPSLEWLGGLDSTGFRTVFRGSPLERTKRPRLLRNVAIAMGNSGERAFASQLRTWAEGDDSILAEAARWALQRLALEDQAASIGCESAREPASYPAGKEP